jgi:hypothetical protein
LILLAAVLSGVLGLGNRYGAAFPWWEFVTAVRDEPFGRGLSVTFMLSTTLIPTFLHLGAGLVALVVPIFARSVIARWPDANASIVRTFLVVGSIASTILSILLFLGILYGLFWLIRAGFPGLGGWLAQWTLMWGSFVEGAASPG